MKPPFSQLGRRRVVLRLLSPWKWHFAGLLALGIILNSAAAVADPLLAKLLVDQISAKNFGLFIYIATGILVFAVVYRGGTFIYQILAQRLQNAIARDLTLRMLDVFFKTPYEKLSSFTNGYFVSRIYDEPVKIATSAVATGGALSISTATFIAGFAVALYLAAKITMLLLLIVPPLYFLSFRMNKTIARVSKTENEEEAKVREVLGRVVDSYKTVKLFGLFRRVRSRVTEQVDKRLGVLYVRVKTASGYQAFSNTAVSFAEALVFIGAGYEAVAGSLSIGDLFGFMSAFWKVMAAATRLIKQVPELSKLTGYAERLCEFEELSHETGQRQDYTFIEDSSVEFNEVGIRYGSRQIFENLNLKIRADEKILVLGPNGSGKTTIANVLARFTKPYRGVVRSPDPSRISALITPFHFIPGTLKDNVNYDELSIEKRRLFAELVEEFGLIDKVEADVFAGLSEGEKKKCQIIMTLLKDADCYVFDEPLAHLDTESKEKVIKRQLQLTQGKTLVIIMHGDEDLRTHFDRTFSTKEQQESEVHA